MTHTSDDTAAGALLNLLSDSGQTVSSYDEDIRHRKVKDTQGADIGHVADLLIDEVEHKVRFLLVEHGGLFGFGSAKTLVPVDDVVEVGVDEVRIDHSKTHVASGPGYDPELMNNPVYLGSVYDHYDYVPYWDRGYGYARNPGYRIDRGIR